MPRIPLATYRLQLHAGFPFDDAASISSYLYKLGVSHAYLSPYLQAAPGSTHGYDVVDHRQVNHELGGKAAHTRFCESLRQNNLGQILDIVPNHMSLAEDNKNWWDVLENGEASRYASYFDIDWQPAEARLRDKVLVPILGDQYGRILSAGEIKIVRNGSKFLARYHDHLLPVSPTSLAILLSSTAEAGSSDMIAFLSSSYMRLPTPDSNNRKLQLVRQRDKYILDELLHVYLNDAQQAEAVDKSLEVLNSDIDALDHFLNHQYYRLAFWRTADQELGYRRFFNVNTLVGLRVEKEHVFNETHILILKWLKDGTLDGLRIDHPDGLRDPLQYFQRLRQASADSWIIAEKILAQKEELRPSWPIHGTTGYDFMNEVMGLFISPRGLQDLTEIYERFSGEPTDFQQICRDKKLLVMQESLGSDVNRLVSIFVEICEANRDRRDYTRTDIRRAIREVAADMPVYRTYVTADSREVSEEDQLYIYKAIEKAKLLRPDLSADLFDFLGDVLTLKLTGTCESEFVMRFQQFTSPVMAKGVEDMAFYCFNRFVAANEVGGNPAKPEVAVSEFHASCQGRQTLHPQTMLSLSTHDTKRSEDVRARLCAITEIPARWGNAVRKWARMNRSLKTDDFPDANAEYFYYQTLVGVWPISFDRLAEYMQKAAREARQHTSWTSPNEIYESALRTFVSRTLGHDNFIRDLEQFVGTIKGAGFTNSLSQILLKNTTPGVPDLYQGSELWDFSLVDPDNRRPVDYSLRKQLLDQLDDLSIEEVTARAEEGLPKLLTTYRSLLLRRDRPNSFGPEAAYLPLPVRGPKSDNIIAFQRSTDIVVIVPRLALTAAGHWAGTTVDIPLGTWKNVFTAESIQGGPVKLQLLFHYFPIALLKLETDQSIKF